MGTITYRRVALHGETDEAQATLRAVEQHALKHPGWRSAEWRAEHMTPEQNEAYETHPMRPPEPEAPACDVTVVFADAEGYRLEIHTTVWADAEHLAQAETFGVPI